MSIKVTIPLAQSSDDLLSGYGAGALLHVESAATKAGAYTEVGAGTVIVSGTETYEVWDSTGTDNSWYKSRVGDSGNSSFSDYSVSFQVGAGAYASLEQFKAYVRDSDTATADDNLMLLALDSASRAVDRTCNRRFDLATGTATVRYFTPQRTPVQYGSWRYSIPVDDTFDDAPTIALDATGNGSYVNSLSSFRMAPLNAAAKGRPFTSVMVDIGQAAWARGDYGASVSADWGWTAVPDSIALATMMQAARFLKRRDAPFGVAGSPEMGSELRLLARLDPDVAVLVATYRRVWGAV